MMPEYEDIDLSEFALLAEKSSTELGAHGNRLYDYETGGAFYLDADTAMFVASARSIVLEMVRRIRKVSKGMHYEELLYTLNEILNIAEIGADGHDEINEDTPDAYIKLLEGRIKAIRRVTIEALQG